MSAMRTPRIAKVTLNVGVGEAGEAISKAEDVLKQITNCKPVRTIASDTVPGFGVKQNQQIGCKVTVRGEKAERVLRKTLTAVDNIVPSDHFDDHGNFAFGVKEHIDIEGLKYDPKTGIYGMDVCVTMERPGYRVAKRTRMQRKLSKSHLLTKEESIKYIQEKFGVKDSE